ncbi:EAL domain-containing protein [Kosakonia sp. BK9b]
MQTAQRIIQGYRRKRAIFCVVIAFVALIATLSFRFISERNANQQQMLAFTQHAVQSLEKLLQPLTTTAEQLVTLAGTSCADAHPKLRKEAASLQTVRAIALVKEGILYCSSIFGYRSIPVHQLQPDLPHDKPVMMLTTDRSLLKGTPLMIIWYPVSNDGQSGVMEAINIGLLSSLMFEPQAPLITRVILRVGERYLVPDVGVTVALPSQQDEKTYQQSSAIFPFAVNISGPGASELALRQLPTQLPLAIMIGLLTGFIAWFATASRMSFSREINLGLAAHEFELFCQPLVNARTLQCTGVEILLRWHNPRQGWISPEVFIPIAEDHHLIAPLTRYVIIETQRQLVLFPDSPNFHIGINVAPSHLRHGELLKDLNQLWYSKSPHQQLVIELTERDALQDVDSRMVRELHRKGTKIAIDDFGTGNSSLAWLEKLNPDVLKIDKSYTAAIGTDAVNSTVTDMIIALGQRLHIELVAEGVEQPQQAQYLRQQEVHHLQGFLFAKPMPIGDFPTWLAGNNTPPAQPNGQIVPLMPG